MGELPPKPKTTLEMPAAEEADIVGSQLMDEVAIAAENSSNVTDDTIQALPPDDEARELAELWDEITRTDSPAAVIQGKIMKMEDRLDVLQGDIYLEGETINELDALKDKVTGEEKAKMTREIETKRKLLATKIAQVQRMAENLARIKQK